MATGQSRLHRGGRSTPPQFRLWRTSSSVTACQTLCSCSACLVDLSTRKGVVPTRNGVTSGGLIMTSALPRLPCHFVISSTQVRQCSTTASNVDVRLSAASVFAGPCVVPAHPQDSRSNSSGSSPCFTLASVALAAGLRRGYVSAFPAAFAVKPVRTDAASDQTEREQRHDGPRAAPARDRRGPLADKTDSPGAAGWCGPR